MEYRNGCAAQMIHNKIAAVYPNDVPSLRTIQRWMSDFGSGERKSFLDSSRSGRPCVLPLQMKTFSQ